jgi:uncharacterized membrane protein
LNSGKPRRQEIGLDSLLGIMLLGGVAASLALEVAGIVVYWFAEGGLSVSRDPAAFLTAEGFFTLLGDMFRQGAARRSGLGLMTVGIVILILTPLARVVISLLFFAWKREPKYVVLTLLVLVILLVSLAVH